MFARDHWYVVAAGDEIGDRPLGRVVLGEPLVLFRGSDGEAVALAEPDGFEVNVKIDRGGLHARRMIRDLIAREHATL